MQSNRDTGYHYDQELYATSYDEHPIWYGISGTGKQTIVLIDGIACIGYAFRYIRDRFSKTHRMIHLHYRGHGKTAAGVYEHLSMSCVIQDIKAVVDHSKSKNVVFIAHSMGVQVIFEYYRQYREDVAALIPICGGYGSIMNHFHNTDIFATPSRLMINQLLKPYRRLPLALFHRIVDSVVVRRSTMMTEVNGALLDESDMERYFHDIKYHLDIKAFGYLLEAAMDHSTYDILPQVSVPVFIIAGKRDRMTPAKLSQEMADKIPHSELVILPWGSHTVPIEQPEMTILLIEQFLLKHHLV